MIQVPQSGIVFDASVLINIVATDCQQELLAAFGVPALIDERAAREVLRHPREKRQRPGVLEPLLNHGALKKLSLSSESVVTFLELTGAQPPDDLDDGEAATIAQALDIGAAAALDDKKARRICRERFPDLPVVYSVEFFKRAEVTPGVRRQAVFDALYFARMRTPVVHRDWVFEVLGEMAQQIPHLPRRS